MAADVMRVKLHLRETRVLEVQIDTPSELRLVVESTVTRPRCQHCGFKRGRVHDTRAREIRDLEVSGRAVTLVWRRRRLVCGNCGERWSQDHPEFDGKLTRRLAQRLVADAQVMPVMSVARRYGIGWHQVMGLVRAWSQLIAEHRRQQRCRVLLVEGDLDARTPPLCDGDRQRRHRTHPGCGPPPRQRSAERVFNCRNPIAGEEPSK